MDSHHKRFLRRSSELLLWIAAASCFALIAKDYAVAKQADRDSAKMVTASSTQRDGESSTTLTETKKVASGEIIGRLKIAALGISVPMTAGVESGSLLRGVGHVDGTAFPGGLGTLALAGHRDTYLRPLEHIAKKMDVEVTDATGTYHYEVESWEIVAPEEVDVLSIRDKPELVLITCYPFHYIGAAPKRFVVHARLVSLAPEAHRGDSMGADGHN